MIESPGQRWTNWRGSLCKFRALGPRATEIVRNPHLYFSPIKEMNDRTEVGAQLVIHEDQGAIRRHLEEYRSVLNDIRAFEFRHYLKQRAKWEEDILAPFNANRRAGRVRSFDARIAHANELIGRLEGMDGPAARQLLIEFYESVRKGLREAAVCCVTKTAKFPKMWEEYADLHRGVCFEFHDRIFKKDKKIERVDVVYTLDGKLHPLESGYLNSYRSLYSTKHSSYGHEEEVRFFLFGERRPVPVKPADLVGVILGSEALAPLSDPTLEAQRRENIRTLAAAVEERNRRRNYEHHTLITVATWVGFELYERGISASQLLAEHQ